MAILSKENALFIRKDGKLVAQTIVLETLEDKPEVEVIPLTRAEIQEIGKKYLDKENKDTTEGDKKLIVDHFVKPSFTEVEVEDIKPFIANAMIIGLMSLSTGTSQKDIKEKSTERVTSDVSKK